MSYNSEAVTKTRRKHKEILVAEHGGQCLDCGMTYPPFVMQFDHRDTALKSFAISGRMQTASLARKREELKKCDLVCANCHSWRTHRQRCSGCKYCEVGTNAQSEWLAGYIELRDELKERGIVPDTQDEAVLGEDEAGPPQDRGGPRPRRGAVRSAHRGGVG